MFNKKITHFFGELYGSMLKEAKDFESLFVKFGCSIVFFYLFFYIFNVNINHINDENLILRVIAVTLGLGLTLKNFWPESTKRFLPIYWYFTLTYCFPFFFFFMLFQNPESNIWQINGLVGVVALTFFMDWIAYIFLLVIGVSLAYLAFYFTNANVILSSDLIVVFGSYTAPLYYLLTSSHKKKKIHDNNLFLEQQLLNIALTKKSEDLEKALNIKTDFLNNISHEIRTPINGLVNLSSLLSENWKKYSDSEHYKIIKTISESSKRLIKIINNVLDISKFTSGKMSMTMIEGNLEELLKAIIVEFESIYLIQYKDIVIETNIQIGIDSTAKMDPERIHQVLRNLIDNAFKFSKAGKIKISLRTQGKNLEVVIEDEGIGIPEQQLEEIFNPFIQSNKTKGYTSGTGLGLSICKEIIAAHNGKIWAVNKIIGSSFHFTLPRLELMKLDQEVDSNSIKGTALMIDDDELSHAVMRMILNNDGYEVISFYNGVDGLEYLSQNVNKINFIFLDLMMPGMHGLDVLRKIKSDESLAAIPVIIQSASNPSDEASYSQAMELGATGFFRKPYSHKEISEFVNKILL
ncbi:REC domain containing protein [uncultured Caudovirales phage]|uniref:histidine kinase n=1 Tax=uncultured Caudovirales phage TaxID=2100421 RepID=A0A6J5PIG8_9CAUD|nr:REC domain containing protein [uncultured Caudovirales phage]CAB4176829.1 REC domain containing protein [uncultured Caudovirales phage]CAB4181089.1 REC domain containing protein [uncultured Caudovirales phage]CAB4198163.1 REC domain containing protein [uncultured Caudovirales phage]CAB4210586.1 REC domain containing protein [uncultured Caudovirales phage]